jgi:hypothetical protein
MAVSFKLTAGLPEDSIPQSVSTRLHFLALHDLIMHIQDLL